MTRGYNLPAKFVIHTVGPVWHGGRKNEAKLLEQCYSNSLKLADQAGLKTIAFPAISTGVYGYPQELAAQIAVAVIRSFSGKTLEKATLVAFSQEDYDVYKKVI